MRATSSLHTPPRLAALALLAPVALSLLVLVARPATLGVRSIMLAGSPQVMLLVPHSPWAVVASDDASVQGDDASVQMVNLDHARVVRTRVVSTSAVPISALALDPATHHLFLLDPRDGVSPSLLHVLDSRAVASRASVPVGRGAIALAVDARHGLLLVANEASDSVSILDTRTAHLWRTVPLDAAPVALAADTRRERAFVLEWRLPRATTGFPINRGPIRGQLGVLDTRRGVLLRTVAVGTGPAALAVDTRRGRVFVANQDDGTVSVLDAGSGALLRTTTVGSLPTTLAVDARRGLVYVVSMGDGTLSLLDAQSGQFLRTVRLAGLATPASPYVLPAGLAVDEARDRVYVSAWGPAGLVGGTLTLRGHGTLYVLDARTGALRRRIAVGVAPQAIAVAASGRVVVLNEGGVVAAPEGWLAPWLRRLGGWLPWLGRSVPPAPGVRRVPGSLSVVDAPA